MCFTSTGKGTFISILLIILCCSLSQWLVHSSTCPQCRDKCAKKSVIKLYINSSAPDVEKDVADLDSDQLKVNLYLFDIQ